MIILLRSEQGGLYWTESRKSGLRIPASEVAALLCMYRYKSRNKLFKEKKYPHTKKRNQETPATQHGRFWEQFALAKVADFFPEKEGWRLLRPGSFLDFDEPFSCSPDMMVDLFDPERNLDLLIGIETKCPYSAPIPKRKEDICSAYLLQCFCCLMTTEADKWILVFYDSPTDSVTSFEIYPDYDLWARKIVPRVRQFLELVRDNSGATFSNPVKMRKVKKDKIRAEKLRGKLLELTFPVELSLGSSPKNNAYQ